MLLLCPASAWSPCCSRRGAGATTALALVAIAGVRARRSGSGGLRPDRGGCQFAVDGRLDPELGISYHVGIDGLSPAHGPAHDVPDAAVVLGLLVRRSRSRCASTSRCCCCSRPHDRRRSSRSTSSCSTFLGGDAHPDVLPHRHLGRRATASTPRSSSSSTRCAGSLLMLVAISGARHRSARAHRDAVDFAYDQPACEHATCSRRCAARGCSSPSRWRSRSRCRCCRSTPGCPTRTSRRPRRARSILAGVLLKMGTYGFLRFAIPLFPASR